MFQALEGKLSFPPSARITAIVRAHPRIFARVPAPRNSFDRLTPHGGEFEYPGCSGYTGCQQRRFGNINNRMKHESGLLEV
jgi:hypothetical protein